MNWQPMDSAPTDGTRVLVNFDGAGPVVAFKPASGSTAWTRYLGFGKSVFWPTIHDAYATHWMPLPEPPPVSSQDGEGG